MDEFDVFDLLAGSFCNDASVEAADSGPHPFSWPVPLPPLPLGNVMQTVEPRIIVQTVLLEDVRALGDTRFNSTNHHEWSPFRHRDENAVLVDPSWWDSLGPTVRAELGALVDITVANHEIAVPHESDIKKSRGCLALYHGYVDLFSFARWATLKPDAKIVALNPADRAILEALARRQVLGGTSLQDGDLEEVSRGLLQDIEQAIDSVGGHAFAKTAEKSAKNDVVLRPHSTAISVLKELTSSQDVLQQSLGQDGAGRRKTAQYLVLQPWIDAISKSNEFRIIVSNQRVAAITQQSWGCFAGHSPKAVMTLVPSMLKLWYDVLLPACPYADCILDVCVLDNVAHLIEINPCGYWGSSGSGLIHWIYD